MAADCFRILHVTDEHFCNSHFWAPGRDRAEAEYTDELAQTIANRHFEELQEALHSRAETHPPFDAIVLSGDFTDRYLTQGFEIATYWIKLLRSLVPSGDILLVPGNHDVHLGEKQPSSKTPLPLPRSIAEEGYRAFFNRASFGSPTSSNLPANDHLSVVTRIELRDNDQMGLILIGLNSCRTERLDAKGWGYVGLDQLDSILGSILAGRAGFQPKENDILVAFTHHNPLPLWDLDLAEQYRPLGDRRVSLLTDAPTLLSALNAFGFAALLHGHAHVPKTVRLEGYDPRRDYFNRSIVISGQGSFSANLQDCERHHFAVLQINKDEDVDWRNRHMMISHFYAERCPIGDRRTWVAHPDGGGEHWQFHDDGWRSSAIVDVRKFFRARSLEAADKWNIINSWADLSLRPDDAGERESSIRWQETPRSLAARVTRALGRPINPETVAGIIDRMFAGEEFTPGDLAGTYLWQFIAWKLRRP